MEAFVRDYSITSISDIREVEYHGVKLTSFLKNSGECLNMDAFLPVADEDSRVELIRQMSCSDVISSKQKPQLAKNRKDPVTERGKIQFVSMSFCENEYVKGYNCDFEVVDREERGAVKVRVELAGERDEYLTESGLMIVQTAVPNALDSEKVAESKKRALKTKKNEDKRKRLKEWFIKYAQSLPVSSSGNDSEDEDNYSNAMGGALALYLMMHCNIGTGEDAQNFEEILGESTSTEGVTVQEK